MTARPALASLVTGAPAAAAKPASRHAAAPSSAAPATVRRWNAGRRPSTPAPRVDVGAHRGIVGTVTPTLADAGPATLAVAATVPALPSQWSMLPPRTAGLARPSDAPTIGGSRDAGAPPPVPASAFGAPAGSMMAALLASTDPALAAPSPDTSGVPMSFTSASPTSSAVDVDSIEQRVLDRLEQWKRDELDEHVLRLVERRLQEETERRSWRRGTEVF